MSEGGREGGRKGVSEGGRGGREGRREGGREGHTPILVQQDTGGMPHTHLAKASMFRI